MLDSEQKLQEAVATELLVRKQANPINALRRLGLLALSSFLPVLALSQVPSQLIPTARVQLPAVAGRLDHLGVDVEGKRIFSTAFNNQTVAVIDLRSEPKVRTLGGFANPQGAFYEPQSNHLFVSSSADGTVKVFDGTTFNLLKVVKLSS